MKVQNGISLQPLPPEAKADKQDKQIREAAKMYENHFLGEMVKAMRSTVHHEDGLIKESYGEKIFAQQLDQKYVEGWADKGGIGLSDMIYSQIKERYFGTVKKDFSHPTGALPINPKKDPAGFKMPDTIKMKMLPTPAPAKVSYRFEIPDHSGQPFEAQAPMAGRVTEANSVGDRWRSVKLDHGLGLESELTFPGELAQIRPGDQVEVGQTLGRLDESTPVLAWNLDWSKA